MHENRNIIYYLNKFLAPIVLFLYYRAFKYIFLYRRKLSLLMLKE